MKTWKYNYNSQIIEVKNSASLVELYVNGELQDRKRGLALSADVAGKLSGGEEIKASLGGDFKVECSLFVDNVLQEPVEIS